MTEVRAARCRKRLEQFLTSLLEPVGRTKRRREAGIPEEIVFPKKWELALETIDQIRDRGLPDQVELADAGYGDGTEFREELQKRGVAYALGASPQAGVCLQPPELTVPEAKRMDRPPSAVRYGNQRPILAEETARQAQAWKKIRWREGAKGWLETRFWATEFGSTSAPFSLRCVPIESQRETERVAPHEPTGIIDLRSPSLRRQPFRCPPA